MYRDNLRAKIGMLSGPASSGLEQSAATLKELGEELQKATPGKVDTPRVAIVQIVEPPPNAMQVMRGVFGPLIAPAGTAAIVVVFVIFMLLQREDLRDRLVRLLGARQMHTTVLALDDAAQRVSRYLLWQTLINSIQGALVTVGLYFIGVPDPALWGALTVVLRFIPYLGPLLAAIGPIALSIAFFDDWSAPLMTVALIATLELLSNNLLEPWLYGSSVGVSSFALIVATVFWAWLWGTAGVFLATPLTVCLVVMGKYIPPFEFMRVMLTDRPVLTPQERFYQRLLADDPEEAQEVIEETRREQTLLEVCDAIVFPALQLIEQDYDRGAIDEVKRRALVELIGEFVDELREADEPKREAGSEAPVTARQVDFKVLCLPAADHADEVAAELFVELVEVQGIEASAASISALKSEMLDRVEEAQPNMVCISATPPAAVIHARYLCKKLHARFPRIPIVVALWDAQGDMQKASDRLTSVGASAVVGNTAQAVEEIARLRQPLIQGVQADEQVATALEA